eukprot:TRINITY_DN1634_c0_g1_i9.p1 TRINITY_DN1634_c0_g1~~TRINITY_DN1634_c0_g1_i9.p1  ORF type:complete len:107 (+),score=19.16 TRINITY_DN1634_c0_g1_i9:661-981(+)
MNTGVKRFIDEGRLVPVLLVTETNFGHKKYFVGTFSTKSSYEEVQDSKIVKKLTFILDEIVSFQVSPAMMVTNRGLLKVFNSAAERELGWKSHDLASTYALVLPKL